jgi:spore germination protein YaaH
MQWALALAVVLTSTLVPAGSPSASAQDAPPSPAHGTARGRLAPATAATAADASARRVVGYYVPYDPTSWESLTAQAPLITDVAAQWVTIDACGQLGSHDDRTLTGFAHERGIRVLPSLLTSSGTLSHRLVTDDATSAQAINQIVEYVDREGYDGFDLDVENVRPEDRAAYVTFVARLGSALHDRGKLLTIAVPAKASDAASPWWAGYDYAALGEQADLVTIMAYEYHGAWGGPGSVAPITWVDSVLAFSAAQIPPEKVLLGLAVYGFDWNTTSGGARPLSYVQAAALAEHHQVAVNLDAETQSATFRYQALPADVLPRTTLPPLQHEIAVREPPPCPEALPAPPATPTPPTPPPDAMQMHEVWLEESTGAAARLGLADRHGIAGVSTWRLGLEDPQFWSAVQHWRSPNR